MAVRLTQPGEDLVPRRKPRRVRKSKYDWDTIRKEYTEGIQNSDSNDPLDIRWPTLVELSHRHGIPEGTVLQRSGREKWVAVRRSQRLQMDVRRRRERARLMAKEGKAFDTSVLNISKIGLNTILLRMSEILRSSQQRDILSRTIMEQMERGELVNLEALSNLPGFDAKEIEQLSNAAVRFEELGRRVLGDPQETVDEHDVVEEEIASDQVYTTGEDRLSDMLTIMAGNGLLTQLVGKENVRALEAAHSNLDDELDTIDDLDIDDEESEVIEAELVEDNGFDNKPIFGVA